MISYEEALDILHAQERPSPVTQSANESCGYVAAQDAASDVLVPPFANSAMDGFAVRSADLVDASEDNPVTLLKTGSTVAGDTPSAGQGGAWEIMTGAPVPQGYDAVVKVEDVKVNGDQVTFIKPVELHNNIRDAGEDIMPGDVMIEVGTTVSPMHVMALATVGQKDIAVMPKPKVTVFTTGKEIIDDADAALLPGQIRNSNSPYLMAALDELSVDTSYGGIIADEPEQFEQRVKQALFDTDIFISTGAVSMGTHDFIPDSLRKLGAEILFHKVMIRPGKPILYARFPDGTHYFGLPGNPVSAAVGLRFFVVPLLCHLQGMEIESPITARLLAPSSKKQGFRFFRKAHVSVAQDGTLQLDILKGQESFKIHPLLQANCWASFTEDQTGLEIGETIDVYPLNPGAWTLDNVA